MNIRRAFPSESDQLSAIALASKGHWGYSPQQLGAWQRDLQITSESIAAQPTFVAVSDDNELLGVVQIGCDALPWRIEHLWVRPASAGSGVGSRLVHHALAHARAHGQHELHVDADPHAEAFYLHLGARRIGTVAAPVEGEPARVRPQLVIGAGEDRRAEAMQTLAVGDLRLEPLVVAHAEEMYAVLSDPSLYRHLDYPPPPSLEHLRDVYARVEGRLSPDGTQRWLNWVVRPSGAAAVGYVQLTVEAQAAWVGFVFSSRHWGRGNASQATRAMMEHAAAAYGVTRFLATVEVDNERSIRLLGRLGFRSATPQERDGHDLTATERLFVA